MRKTVREKREVVADGVMDSAIASRITSRKRSEMPNSVRKA